MTKGNSEKPAVLYKYLPADRALQALPEKGGDGALRATQPSAMNDPLECATRCNAEYPNEKVEASEIVSVLNRIVPNNPFDLEQVKNERLNLGTQAWNELFRRQLSQRLGVVAFSTDSLHPLLWSHYAESGSGFVIGYKVSELEKIATGHQQLDSVHYFKAPPVIEDLQIFNNERNLHRILLAKSKNWEYEKEWRLTQELRNTMGTGQTDKTGHSINLCKIPNEAVSEIYYTERVSRWHLHQIKARLQNPNNRFGTKFSRRLILKPDLYEYKLEGDLLISALLGR